MPQRKECVEEGILSRYFDGSEVGCAYEACSMCNVCTVSTRTHYCPSSQAGISTKNDTTFGQRVLIVERNLTQ